MTVTEAQARRNRRVLLWILIGVPSSWCLLGLIAWAFTLLFWPKPNVRTLSEVATMIGPEATVYEFDPPLHNNNRESVVMLEIPGTWHVSSVRPYRIESAHGSAALQVTLIADNGTRYDVPWGVYKGMEQTLNVDFNDRVPKGTLISEVYLSSDVPFECTSIVWVSRQCWP